MNVRREFGSSKKKSYLRGMKSERFIITAYSRLLRMRVAISPALPIEMAENLLEKERSRKISRGPRPYIRLKIEKVKPVQLTIKFNDYEQ